jgi:hypothetical protein
VKILFLLHTTTSSEHCNNSTDRSTAALLTSHTIATHHPAHITYLLILCLDNFAISSARQRKLAAARVSNSKPTTPTSFKMGCFCSKVEKEMPAPVTVQLRSERRNPQYTSDSRYLANTSSDKSSGRYSDRNSWNTPSPSSPRSIATSTSSAQRAEMPPAVKCHRRER